MQPRYLSEDYDWKMMIECARLSRGIFSQGAFEPFRGDEIFPGAEVQTDEGFMDFIRKKAETIYHPIGTCKMGVDEMAVVDPQLNCARRGRPVRSGRIGHAHPGFRQHQRPHHHDRREIRRGTELVGAIPVGAAPSRRLIPSLI